MHTALLLLHQLSYQKERLLVTKIGDITHDDLAVFTW